MANGQPLGELDVVITGDWSELEQSLNDALSAAQTTAQGIEAAFSDTSVFDGLVTALDLATESIYEMGDAAASVSSGIADAASAADDLGSAADTAEAAISATSDATGVLGDSASAAVSALDEISASAS